MPSGGNAIRFKFDPSDIHQQDSLYKVAEPVADNPKDEPADNKPAEQEPKPIDQEKEKGQKPNEEPKPAPTTGGQEPQKPKDEGGAEPPSEEPKPEDSDYSEEVVIKAYNKKHGTNYKSLDELSTVKEVEKVVEKEAELPQDVQQYLRFKEENPDKGFSDWTELNKDYTNMPNMDLAREAIRAENSGLDLTSQEVDILLAEKMKVDIDDLDSLEGGDLVRLKSFAHRHRQAKLQEQAKYKQPKEQKPKEKENEKSQPVGETVTLTNGQVVPKEAYEKSRREYNEKRQKAVDGLKSFELSLEIDHNGEKKELPFKYDYKPEDKHSMLSTTEDVGNILNSYQSSDGFNHDNFNEDMWWSKKENREKAIKAMLVDARSKGVDEVIAKKRNINFDNKPQPKPDSKGKDGYANGKVLDHGGRSGSYGVKYSLPSE